jgi:hypothetical protein
VDNNHAVHIHQQILRLLRIRVALALRVEDDNFPTHSVGDLLNILFLVHGQYGCIGEYNVTARALHALVGDLLWAKPESTREVENVPPVVN